MTEFQAQDETPQLTLSNPAMFWFSAKNSAGLLNCTFSPLPRFFPLLAMVLLHGKVHSQQQRASCTAVTAGPSTNQHSHSARAVVVEVAGRRENAITTNSALIRSNCRSSAPPRPARERQAPYLPVLRWGGGWPPAPLGSP